MITQTKKNFLDRLFGRTNDKSRYSEQEEFNPSMPTFGGSLSPQPASTQAGSPTAQPTNISPLIVTATGDFAVNKPIRAPDSFAHPCNNKPRTKIPKSFFIFSVSKTNLRLTASISYPFFPQLLCP